MEREERIEYEVIRHPRPADEVKLTVTVQQLAIMHAALSVAAYDRVDVVGYSTTSNREEQDYLERGLKGIMRVAK